VVDISQNPGLNASQIHEYTMANSQFGSDLPSGKLTFLMENIGKSPCLMGKSTISMAIFNSFLYVHQRVVMVFDL